MALCKYALSREERKKRTGYDYPFPYKCIVSSECRFNIPSEEKARYCPRRIIGENQEKEGKLKKQRIL